MSYNNQLFAAGVRNVLLVNWTLCCATPLAIRNGIILTYRDNTQKKGRGRSLALRWETVDDDTQEHQVSALHYSYAVEDGVLRPYHQVPASSVRGALRNWTIRHFVNSDYTGNLMPPPKNTDSSPAPAEGDNTGETPAEETAPKTDESNITPQQAEHIANVLAALSDRQNGYQLIASLFGLATDTRSELSNHVNAGRFQIQTEPFAAANTTDADPAATGFQPVDVYGGNMTALGSPSNVTRQMTVRNPLDRMIQASREGGLHHFLEIAAGARFNLTMRIVNVTVEDLALLALWRREINDGLLRIGALTSIGRGRLTLQEDDDTYVLWQRPDATLPQELDSLLDAGSADTNDILDDFWSCHTLPPAALEQFIPHLQAHVGGPHS